MPLCVQLIHEVHSAGSDVALPAENITAVSSRGSMLDLSEYPSSIPIVSASLASASHMQLSCSAKKADPMLVYRPCEQTHVEIKEEFKYHTW